MNNSVSKCLIEHIRWNFLTFCTECGHFIAISTLGKRTILTLRSLLGFASDATQGQYSPFSSLYDGFCSFLLFFINIILMYFTFIFKIADFFRNLFNICFYTSKFSFYSLYSSDKQQNFYKYVHTHL